MGPILYKLFSLLHRRKSRLGPVPFNLGNAYFLVGRIHEVIEGIQQSQLERELLMLLDGIMGKLLCALADLLGRPISAVGQNISDSFPPGQPVKQPEKSPLFIGRASFKVLVGQNAGFVELNSEGQNLRGRE